MPPSIRGCGALGAAFLITTLVVVPHTQEFARWAALLPAAPDAKIAHEVERLSTHRRNRRSLQSQIWRNRMSRAANARLCVTCVAAEQLVDGHGVRVCCLHQILRSRCAWVFTKT